jgi:CheY-like chemotaxis protein
MAMIKKTAGKNDMSKRILVVDDQPDNRQIIRDILAPTDYEITEAENGEEALALSRNGGPIASEESHRRPANDPLDTITEGETP